MENNLFEDAEKLQRDNPATFQRPTAAELNQIKNGDNIKICCCNEKFWVKVETVSGTKISGRVNNDLMNSHVHGLNYGDEITCEKKNVYAINAELRLPLERVN